MVTITLHCPHCLSDALVRNGHAPNGKQLYRCRACGRQSRENPTPHAYPEARREEILHASSRAQQSAWSHPHFRGLSYHGAQLDQKKGAQLPPLRTTLLVPDPEDPTSPTLELDERMARLCLKKRTTPGFGLPYAVRHDRWSLMPWVIGAGKTCQRLWEAIPQGYRQGHCFTDFWATYAAVIPEQQHTAVGKETGETAHVERWNNTLRQRMARFVRMPLSFSRVSGHARSLFASLSSSLQY
jgi:insertion element IS1 protein InsB